uniref:Nucleotide-diphospho-sugar transferase domain-containing protein n=1 Tax=Emiliania huxleyi TaxID=2903 RepID=A0A7S3SKX0_EMIHU
MAPATSAGAFVQRGVCEVDNSDRRRLLSRALHLGYDMLSVDSDIIWTGDPYPSAASLPLDAAFATDVAPPMGKANDRDRAVIGESTTSHLPLNSGFMLARPEAQRLFAEVARRLRHRLLQPPNRTVASGRAREEPVLHQVFPQMVLNEVVKQWRSTPWSIHSGAGSVGDAAAVAGTASASAKLGTLRIGVLPHSTVGRLCGKRLSRAEADLMWQSAAVGNCSLAASQLGLHAQMVNPLTRRALWPLLHPMVRAQARDSGQEALGGAHGAAASPSVVVSSALTPHVCLCRDPEQGMGSGCRTLMPQHSYRTGVKRCKGFAPGSR